MRRFLYHIIRIIPLLALIAVAAWIILNNWRDGKTVSALVHVAASLLALLLFARWLYGGHFQPKSVRRFILRYRLWRFLKRDILPFCAFAFIGMACAVGIFAFKEPDTLRDPEFYILLLGFILAFGLFKTIVGYIKYCYTHD